MTTVPGATPYLSLRNIVKQFGDVRAVDDVSLDVARGELLCLLGPSGCGKSTLLRIIGGFEAPNAGSIEIEGQSITALPPNKRPTAMVFQSHALWPHMSVFGNIAYGLRLRRLARAAVRDKVEAALELTGLKGLGGRGITELSGGQQQRVAIARAIVLEPKILLMDEPFSSLDAHLRIHLRDEIYAIQRRLKITTIFVTHDQEEALTLADRIAILNAGRIEQLDRPSAIYDRPRSAFVAGFVGTMNLLEGAVRDGLFETDGVSLPIAAPDGPATLAVRAEDLDLVPGQDGLALPGTVRRVIDLGASRLVKLELDGGKHIKVRLTKGQDVSDGQPALARPRAAILYRDGAEPRELAFRAPPMLVRRSGD